MQRRHRAFGPARGTAPHYGERHVGGTVERKYRATEVDLLPRRGPVVSGPQRIAIRPAVRGVGKTSWLTEAGYRDTDEANDALGVATRFHALPPFDVVRTAVHGT